MKKVIYSSLLILGIWTLAYNPGLSRAEAAHGHSGKDMNMERMGKKIRQITIKDHTLIYHLLNPQERVVMEKMMKHHAAGMDDDATWHSMLYIERRDGTVVPAEVEFQVSSPDGKVLKPAVMGMKGGYGVNIPMKLKGDYAMKAAIVTEAREPVSLDDEFVYQAK